MLHASELDVTGSRAYQCFDQAGFTHVEGEAEQAFQDNLAGIAGEWRVLPWSGLRGGLSGGAQ